MKNPPILPGEDKKLLKANFNHKKVTLFSVGKRSGAVARQAGGLVFPLFSAEQSDGGYGKPDRCGDPERQQNDIRIVGKTVSDERDDSARDEISRRHADQCGEKFKSQKNGDRRSHPDAGQRQRQRDEAENARHNGARSAVCPRTAFLRDLLSFIGDEPLDALSQGAERSAFFAGSQKRAEENVHGEHGERRAEVCEQKAFRQVEATHDAEGDPALQFDEGQHGDQKDRERGASGRLYDIQYQFFQHNGHPLYYMRFLRRISRAAKRLPIVEKEPPERVYSIGNLQKTKFYMGTPKGESTKTAIS